MAATYGADPNEPIDRIRLLTGDTDVTAPLLQDEEIEFLVANEGPIYMAAAAAADAIAGKFARKVDTRVGGISKSNSQATDHYLKLAKRLRSQQAEQAVSFYAGGLSKAEKRADAQDSDLPQPDFTRELHDNPYAGDPLAADEFDP